MTDWPPLDADCILEVVIPGKQPPAGSKTAFALRRKDKRGIWRVILRRDRRGNESAACSVTDMNESKLKKRKREVLAYLLAGPLDGYEMPEPDDGIAVEVTFFWPRPKNQYGTGRNADVLKDSARPYKTTDPDATKLWRGLEDHLTGVLWHDDNQVVRQLVMEDYVHREETEAVRLTVWRMPRRVASADNPVIVPEQASLGLEGEADAENPRGVPDDSGRAPLDFPGLS